MKFLSFGTASEELLRTPIVLGAEGAPTSEPALSQSEESSAGSKALTGAVIVGTLVALVHGMDAPIKGGIEVTRIQR